MIHGLVLMAGGIALMTLAAIFGELQKINKREDRRDKEKLYGRDTKSC